MRDKLKLSMNHLDQLMRSKLTIHRTSFCSTRSCLSYWVENHPTNPVNTRIRTTRFWSIHLLILAEWICRTRDSDPIVSTCWWYIRSCQRHTIQDIAWYTEWHWRCVCWNKFLAVFSEKLRAKNPLNHDAGHIGFWLLKHTCIYAWNILYSTKISLRTNADGIISIWKHQTTSIIIIERWNLSTYSSEVLKATTRS